MRTQTATESSPDRDLAAYYGAVAPFYAAETSLRGDLAPWVALARRLGARTILDLGCGSGRVAEALAPLARVTGIDRLTLLLPNARRFAFARADMRALPFADATFDLAIAANDPLAHLLGDADRTLALREAARVARSVVIDGLYLPAADRARAHRAGLVREATLADRTERRETWRALGGDRYRATYRYLRDGRVVAEAVADVRGWQPAEPALRGLDPRLAGGLDGGAFDPDGRALVILIGGAR